MVAGKPVHKVLGAALGDGAQVFDGFLFTHADAAVGNGDGFGRRVPGYAHVEGGLVFVQGWGVECFEAELVGCVGSVADQLPQEDVRVGIERMRDQMQQLGHFGLERVGLYSHVREQEEETVQEK